jgi:2-amino-4-hydroxy-6-hydroxymethyldihydropteridine diphosphokinase
VFLSLGSNLGDRRTLIRNGLKMLSGAGVKVLRVSSLYRTEPVDLRSQPWFINCAAEVETKLSPRGLLRLLKSTERALGRRRGTPKGPRPIDIDILLYENVVVRSPALTIPHARMKERRFVLVPLREIAPRVLHPATRKTVSAMLRETADVSKVVKLKKK